MGDLLAPIVTRKREEVAARLGGRRVHAEPTNRSLAEAIARPGARFIMEVKRRSPSGHRAAATVEQALAAYADVADAVSLPIFIYNIPGRSVIDMTPETMGKLARAHKNIVGVKDATGKIERVSEQRTTCGKEFIQLSGEDVSALGFNAHGGVGCISVTANVAPRLCAEFQEATLSGDRLKAIELQDRLMPLHKAIFIEPGVSGAKYALSRLNRVENVVRSPLLPVEEGTAARIDAAMKHAGLID